MTITELDGPSELRAQVRAFLEQRRADGAFEPQCDGWCRGFDRAFSRGLGARGWVGMTIPERYGGAGGTARERFVVAEELLAAGAPISAHWTAERQIAPMLMRIGSEQQRERLLPGIARGELSFAVGMSEPSSGSDLASVRTRAVKADGGWIVSGQKVWSTAADLADHMILLCRTGLGEDRHEGLSQLLVNLRAPDVDVRPIHAMNGQHDFCEVFLNDVFVPDQDVIGQPGAGWRQVLSELTFERTGPDRYMSTLPLLSRAFAIADLDDRRVAEALGDLVCQLAALRSLSMDVVEAVVAGRDTGADAALTKDAGTKFEQETIEVVRAALGTAVEDDPLARELFSDMVLTAPMITLRGGTTEILRGITARSLTSR
jgi:alkylation response protein AidB-like acyl-CoA dehydrogenase